jgi:GNAT superfamily N-acetyltransferase
MRKRSHAEPPYSCGTGARTPSDIPGAGRGRPAGPAGAVAPAAGGHIRCTPIAVAPAPRLATSRPEPRARSVAGPRGDGQARSTPRRVHGADPAGPSRGRPAPGRRLRPVERPVPPAAVLTPKTELSPAELRDFTDLDHHDHEALGALNHADGRGVGIARYVCAADDPQAAEIAVTLIDDWQGRGLGTELVAQLSECARSEGIRRFTALVAADNRRWQDCCATSGPSLSAASRVPCSTRSHWGRRRSTARLACLALAMIRQPACRTRSQPAHLQRWAALRCSPPSDSQPESRAARICLSGDLSETAHG